MLLTVLAQWWDRRHQPDWQTTVELHRIRRRFEVAQVKSELRRDGAHARRVLRDEMRTLDERHRA